MCELIVTSSDASNLTLLPLLLGLPLTVATTYVYRYYASDDTRSQPHFDRAISFYARSAVIELISEPMHNR
jgi:oligosaccharide translocation protein RFT1